MSKFSDLLGIITDAFQIGLGNGGILLKNTGNFKLAIRNKSDSTNQGLIVSTIDATDNVSVDCSGSTTTNPRLLGLANLDSGNAARVQFGDSSNCFQTGFGARMQILAYHGIESYGAHNGNTPAFSNGSGANDFNLSVVGLYDAHKLLALRSTASATANLIEGYQGGNLNFSVNPLGLVSADRLKLKPYTVATLPSASANEGTIAYVTDGSYPLAISNGTSWAFPGSSGGSSGVSSFNGRTGVITPDVSDYASFYVANDDTRLADARTPTAHNQAWSTITDTPTTLSGYGITDLFPRYNSIGSTVPTSPTDGFRWLETTAAGLKIGDWTFRSATSDWIENDFSIISASQTNIAASATVRLTVPTRVSSKLLIEAVELIAACATTSHSATLFYSFTLQSLVSSSTTSNIAGVPVLNTQALLANNPRTFSQQNVNVTVTVGAGGVSGFVLAIGKTSTPTNINYDYRVTVRRIR